jgi:hypothetical protein
LLKLCLDSARALLRLCSGYSPSARVSLPSAQAKAAFAHVRKLGRVTGKGTHWVVALGPGPGLTQPAKHYPWQNPEFPDTRKIDPR